MAPLLAALLRFDRAEWVPMMDTLVLDLEHLPSDEFGRPRRLFLHEVPSRAAAREVALAVGADFDDEVTAEEKSDPYGWVLRVPMPVLLTGAVWVRSRRTLFLETNIVDQRNMARFFALPMVHTGMQACGILEALRIPFDLQIDTSKSLLEIIADLHMKGKTDKEIASQTGWDDATIKSNLTTFKSYVGRRFPSERAKKNDG